MFNVTLHHLTGSTPNLTSLQKLPKGVTMLCDLGDEITMRFFKNDICIGQIKSPKHHYEQAYNAGLMLVSQG